MSRTEGVPKQLCLSASVKLHKSGTMFLTQSGQQCTFTAEPTALEIKQILLE